MLNLLLMISRRRREAQNISLACSTADNVHHHLIKTGVAQDMQKTDTDALAVRVPSSEVMLTWVDGEVGYSKLSTRNVFYAVHYA